MLDVLLESPRYFYLGLLHTWWLLGEWVPHYSWREYGSLLKSFLWLIPARVAYGVLFPEKVVVKRFKRSVGLVRDAKVKPSKTDHQTAAAAVFESLKHH
jgi:hypothetical protein